MMVGVLAAVWHHSSPAISVTQLEGADSTAVADSVLLKQLEEQMGSERREGSSGVARTTTSTNPEISAIGDVRAVYRSPAERHFDFEFHEAEFAFKSIVDPYARADFFISMGQDPVDGEFHVELEEAYLMSLALPFGLQAKGGQFRSTFGRMNPVHPHALPIIDLPGVYTNYLGDEGLKDVGVSVSWLVPNPLDFYQELVVEFTGGPPESPSFMRSGGDRFLYLGHLKNFWDLTQNATFELGLTGAGGPNDSSGTTLLGGLDITYKWKPLRTGRYSSFLLQAEAIVSRRDEPAGGRVDSWGAYLLSTVQLSERLFVTGRFDYSNLPSSSSYVERAYSGTLGWLATEFQKLELEVRQTSSNMYPSVSSITLRSVFVIGAHGAHAY